MEIRPHQMLMRCRDRLTAGSDYIEFNCDGRSVFVAVRIVGDANEVGRPSQQKHDAQDEPAKTFVPEVSHIQV